MSEASLEGPKFSLSGSPFYWGVTRLELGIEALRRTVTILRTRKNSIHHFSYPDVLDKCLSLHITYTEKHGRSSTYFEKATTPLNLGMTNKIEDQ